MITIIFQFSPTTQAINLFLRWDYYSISHKHLIGCEMNLPFQDFLFIAALASRSFFFCFIFITKTAMKFAAIRSQTFLLNFMEYLHSIELVLSYRDLNMFLWTYFEWFITDKRAKLLVKHRIAIWITYGEIISVIWFFRVIFHIIYFRTKKAKSIRSKQKIKMLGITAD